MSWPPSPACPNAVAAPAYLGLTLITLALAWTGRGLGRWTGGLIILLCAAFIAVPAVNGQMESSFLAALSLMAITCTPIACALL